MTADHKARTIQVNHLARVEGEGSLMIRLKGAQVEVQLGIFEPPRFFEAFLRGRAYTRGAGHHRAHLRHLPGGLPDERVPRDGGRARGAGRPRPLRALRRLLYCGEWIESHVLHVFLLHAPDFLGYPDAIEMAKDHGRVGRSGLRLKKAGNAIVDLLGGREIHPINIRVGGFYRAARAGIVPPCRNPFRMLLVRLVETAQSIEEAIRVIQAYEPPAAPYVEGPLRAGTGHGCTEAPRGFLYHRYTIDETGTILDAKLVPPTAQNQLAIEQDLTELAPMLSELPLPEATHRAEQAVRNHDPCISCATHFLRLRIERE
jgi:coenzyme F420-reducing hydrogenase alpha subunit